MVCSAQLYAMRDSVQNGYNFWLYLPDGYQDMRQERMAKPNSDDVKDPMPIVLFLHGRSLSGTDLYTVRKYGTIDAIKRGRKINAVVIAHRLSMATGGDLSAFSMLLIGWLSATTWTPHASMSWA